MTTPVPPRGRGPWFARMLAGFAALLLASAAAAQAFSLNVLSGRADSITGGDALLRLQAPAGTALDRVSVRLNGNLVSDRFTADAGASSLTGLIDGMTVGDNSLTVYGNVRGQGRALARFTLKNFPIEGPVFSGPHQQPYICATQSFNLQAGLGTLGATTDPNCHVPTRVDYLYRTTGGVLTQWPAGAAAYPADMAWTTTTLGVSVPYVLRMETGTVNRAIYQTMVLHDPIVESAPSWQAPPQNWNGRLIYTFGGGCFGGWYRQGATTGSVVDDFMLRNGYALASSSLNVFGNNCNDLTAAESMMMVKERFIEAYGPPVHTQGYGCSGGSYAQHQIADNYPGLLDGIIPGCSFPEVGFGTVNFITDAWLLDNYFLTRTSLPWTDEQKRLVTGFMVYATAPNVAVGARRIDPDANCGTLPPELRYNAETNPTGVRCNVYDHTANNYGRDPETGFARRPLDNVGIQYGLKLLNDGSITVDQFLDLNEKVGGFDIDANILPPGERTVADLRATRASYQSGRLLYGGGGLASIPIIDYRAYNDEQPNGDIHVRYHSFSVRERLMNANGRVDNHVMVVEDNRFGLYSTNSPMLQRMILTLDRWITAVNADTRAIPQIDKVVQNKPADLQEGCNTRDPNPSFVAETQVRDPSTTCEALYPSASFPREVAGAPVAADVVKCRLKPLNPGDYAVQFSSDQWTRLSGVFRRGVCDWARPGLLQQPIRGTWQTF